jgi:glyoxylase-like metal-dependent hydrolase (beta-lactamase superfamily II)
MSGIEITPIDCVHRGRRGVISAWQVGDALVDPGPETCLGRVLDGIAGRVDRILVTHVHLDHAGAVGALVRRWPDVEVFVHEAGAIHLAQPDLLWASADDTWEGRAEELWGNIKPVPERNLRPLAGGERLAGGIEVVATPGHASHHVAYSVGGVVFAGDAAGIRLAPAGFVLMPTVPPEFDRSAWLSSLEALEDLRPRRLAIGHYGFVDEPLDHLRRARESLETWSDAALSHSYDDFAEELRVALHRHAGEFARFDATAPARLLYRGITEARDRRRGPEQPVLAGGRA